MATLKKTTKPKEKARSEAPSAAASKKSTARSPLDKLAAAVGPAQPVLVRLATRGLSREALNTLGAKYTSRAILEVIPPLIEAQLLAWKSLSDQDKREHFVGWNEALAAQVVHEGVKLAALLEQFETSAREESGETKVDARRYKDVRAAAIKRRDQIARVLRSFVDPASVEASKLASSKLQSDTPASLAAGIRAVAIVAKGLIATSSKEEREALAALEIHDTLVSSLESLATNVATVGTQRKKGAPATRVAQEQLDEQDGIVLRLIQVTWRAWRDGRAHVPSVPLPDLGALRTLVRTGAASGTTDAEPDEPVDPIDPAA